MGNDILCTSACPADANHCLCSLAPLAAEGRDALKPDAQAGIARVALAQLDLGWENEFHEITIKCADDLFNTLKAEEGLDNPIPPGAHPTRAVLKVHFEKSPGPHFVEIRPPATIIYQDPQDASCLLPYLRKNKFLLLLALVLTLLSAAVPDLDDDDADDDDGNDTHHSHCHLN